MRIAHELAEAICRADLTKEEHSILYVILAKTFGWDKKEDWIATSQMSTLTGIAPEHCSRAVSGLVRKGVITRRFHGRRSVLAIQKRYLQWTCLRPRLEDEKTKWRRRQSQPVSAGVSQPDLAGGSQPVPAGYNRTRTEEDVTEIKKEDARETVSTVPPEILDRLEERLGPGSINQDILAVIRALVQRHGPEHFLRALSESALRLVPPRNLLPWIRSALDAQSKTSYQWAAKRRDVAAAVPLDEEADSFERHALYRQLSGDLVSGPSFAWRRIEQLGPRLNIDVSEFQPLDANPPKPEQERLIRAFVTRALQSHPTTQDAVA